MLTYQTLRHHPSLFRALTSLTPLEFDQLLPAFAKAWQAHLDEADTQRKRKRKRKRGGGRKAHLLTLEDKLLFILVYIKVYPLQVVQGQLFGLSSRSSQHLDS